MSPSPVGPPGARSAGGDPIAARRARIAHVVRGAKRVGYAGLGIAIVAFFAALVTDLAGWAVALTIAGLVVAIVVLPVPIVLGYGIRAAERDERAAAARRGSGGEARSS